MCVSYLGSEEEDGKDAGLWGVNGEMVYSPPSLSVEQRLFFFFFLAINCPVRMGPSPPFIQMYYLLYD